jgi:hypothetical protein
MKGLTIVGISDIAYNKGIEFTEYHEDTVAPEVSTEGIIDEKLIRRKASANRVMRDIEEGYIDCGCSGDGRRRQPIPYSKKVLSEQKSLWTFHLNAEFLGFSTINDFVNKMLMVKENDSVLIHGPSAVYIDDAEVVYSAIKRCKSQKIVISSPYILNTPAAYLLTATNKIVSSPSGVIHMDAGFVGGCGKPTDAMNGMQCEVFRVKRILEVLKNNGFLDDKDIDYIMTNQGQVCKHGRELATIIEKYNEAHK